MGKDAWPGRRGGGREEEKDPEGGKSKVAKRHHKTACSKQTPDMSDENPAKGGAWVLIRRPAPLDSWGRRRALEGGKAFASIMLNTHVMSCKSMKL